MSHSPTALRVAFLVLCAGVPALAADPALDGALARAGANRAALESALARVPAEQASSLRFLIANMPERDLRTLDADFLLEHVSGAHSALAGAPWREAVPEEVFLDAILPYATVDERRDRWRADFRARFAPLVAGAKSAGEAAALLNREIFPLLGVKYSTGRPKANQSPYESIEAGLASCTGLAILLIDACRSVGVPARFVGTPLWSDGSGNHSWVEIWDGGRWRFTGAAEPTGAELDRGWFTDRALRATRDDPRHAIYAVVWRRTELPFPMVWNPEDRSVAAVDVTDRYTAPLLSDGDIEVLAALEAYLRDPAADLAALPGEPWAARRLGRAGASRVRALLAETRAARRREALAAELAAGELVEGDLRFRFWRKTFGERPERGWSIWISLHGGGGAPAEVNDRQWENQKRLYDYPEGILVVPRAPTDTWDLWHQGHIDRFLDRLIEALVVVEGADPDRVYIHGYSAGGDGVFQLAPRFADRLAAAGMMAGHPNETRPDGLRNLAFSLDMGGEDAAYGRNAVAREWESALSRLREADPGGYEHRVAIHEGKGHWMEGADRAALPWMAKHARRARPERVIWLQDDVVHPRFYWLAVTEPRARSRIVVERAEQEIRVLEAEGFTPGDSLAIRLDDAMLDLDREVVVRQGERELFRGVVPRTAGTLSRTLAERGDPRGVYPAEVQVTLGGD